VKPHVPIVTETVFRIGIVVTMVLVLVLQLPSLHAPHHEGDETVLTFLAERLRDEPLHYSVHGSLQGPSARRFLADTWIPLYRARPGPEGERAVGELERLERVELTVDPLHPERRVFDPAIYDHPVFIHPPAYPLLLTLSRIALGPWGGPLLSIAMHMATVLALALLGRSWFGARVGLLAGILVAIDPTSWLAGSHVWTDGMLETSTVLAMLAVARALRSGHTPAFAWAGVVLGLACTTKYPAVLLTPAVSVAFLISERRPSWRHVLAYGAGSASLIVPWVVAFRCGYGAWLPVTKPTAWLMETYPYVSMMAARPWHFYVSGSLCVAPVAVFAIAAIPALRESPRVWIPLTWAVTTLIAMTLLGLSGHGMQLRYLGPGIPAVCLLAAVGIARLRSAASLGVALAAAAATFASSLANARMAEPFPTVLVYVARGAGLPIERWLGGMW
jgi:4-amino-4-deoxy-L-arabinose transferase-like glycosyltransferase